MDTPNDLLTPYQASINQIRSIGHQFWQRGWSLGTSSNYSFVIDRDPLKLVITASGKDKGHLGPNDFVIVDESGTPQPSDQPPSSAETLLHCSAAKIQGANCVLHTHSVWATILSEHFHELGGIELRDFEMLKGLDGVRSHQDRIWIPIFNNSQDIPVLATQVEKDWENSGNLPSRGYILRRHGLYTWGKSISEAVRQVEVLEFLLECTGREMALS